MHEPTTKEKLRSINSDEKIVSQKTINRAIWIEERAPKQSNFHVSYTRIILEYMEQNEGSVILKVGPRNVDVSVSEVKNGVFDRREVAEAVTIERAIQIVNEYFDDVE